MSVRFFGILFSLISFVGCKKDVPTHSLQYEVIKLARDKSTFSMKYLDPSEATVSTGIIDAVLWQSTLYKEVDEGKKYSIEVVLEQGNPSFNILVKKDNSVVAKKEVRSSEHSYLIEGNL